jgi:hypothetical protein
VRRFRRPACRSSAPPGQCEAVVALSALTDGVVVIRAPVVGDAEILIAGRDDEFHRWLGPGAESPAPMACIEVDGRIVGWIDYDTDHEWLATDEVNIGYNVFPSDRGQGHAGRAVELLIRHLANEAPYRTATLLIDRRTLRRWRWRPARGSDPAAESTASCI